MIDSLKAPQEPLSRPENQPSPALVDKFFEEILARSAASPEADAVPQTLDVLVKLFNARFAVLLRKGEKRRHLTGRWEDGRSIGRPDKLYNAERTEQVLLAKEPLLVSGLDEKESWWAGFPLVSQERTLGAVFLEGRGLPSREHAASALAHAPRFALSLAIAMGLDDLKETNRQLREEVEALEPGPAQITLHGYPPLTRAVLEFPMAGRPETVSASTLFSQFPEIMGQSPAMRGVLQSVLVASKSDIPVLIEGESGTGKELVAGAIHRLSSRGDKPLLCENCGALPEGLVESEFFGHEKGAFTGAERQKLGLFERTRGGTIFLDEIGEMDLAMQRKLLRVLQEKVVRRVGGQETIPVDFRVLSATNRVLEQMVAADKFREDLYYRLNVATIIMPPLRERLTDIPLLLEHFSRLFANELGREPLEFSSGAFAALGSYSWPGNVRELRNEVLRLASSEKTRVDAGNLSRRILHASALAAQGPSSKNPRKPLLEIERDTLGGVILEALRTTRGNRAEAARRLGITRSSLYRRLVRYRLISPGKI
jgi:transcriptional regulator with GAF, ATPase, and Fis domain